MDQKCGEQTHYPREKPLWFKERNLVEARFVSLLPKGRIGSYDHLGHYKQMMVLWQSTDTLMCNVFPSNLVEIGLCWWYKLVVESIHNWWDKHVNKTGLGGNDLA